MAVPLRLKVFKGDELVATRDFERDMIKIGRLSTAHLCLDDEKASRIHSVLNVEAEGKLSIVDMGSVEGTFVNGKRVNKGPVEIGDEIRIGGTRIYVEQLDRVAEAAALTATAGTEIDAQTPTPEVAQAAVSAVAAAPAPVALTDTVADVRAPAEILPITLPRKERTASARQADVDDLSGFLRPDSRDRALKLHEKPFGSYVNQKSVPRYPSADTKEIGLQIRYFWGDQLIGVSQHEKPTSVFLGTTSRCELYLGGEELGAQEFEIISRSGDSFMLNLASGMKGELSRNGKTTAISGSMYELQPSDFASVDIGAGIRAEFAFAAQPRRVVVPLSESIDFRFVNLFLLLAFVGGIFISIALTQTEADLIADELSTGRLVVAKFLIKEAEKPKKNSALDKLAALNLQPGESAERHKGDEGKMGKKGAAVDMRNRSAPKAIDINAKDLVKNMGLLKTLGSGGGGGLSTIFGQGGLGGDVKGAIGNLIGSRVGDSGGAGGFGLRGSGLGGGGLGNTIGIGGIGTKGRGGGIGGYGTGVGNLDPKKRVDVGISSEDGVVTGQLDKELIRQVIRRNIGQIRYCYESELQAKPNLAGKVSVRFIIAANGDVQTAKVAEGSTLNEDRLSECIVVRVRSWKFPSPKGGGNVIVTYPFVLKQSGD